MTACLRCDGIECSRTIAEHEGDLRTWWRLARHGDEWAGEVGRPYMGVPMMVPMASIFIDSDEDGVEMDEEMEEFLLAGDDPGAVILHFCSSACLAVWASQSAALEP